MTNKDVKTIYKVMVDEAIAGYIAFNRSNQECVYVNKVAHELVEFDELNQIKDGQTLKFDLNKLFPDVDPEKAKDMGFTPLNDSIFSNDGFYQAILVNKGNGQQFVANVGVKSIEVDGEEHVLMMLQDTTIQTKLQREVLQKQNEIKSAYEELVQQNEQLKALDKAKDRFIALTTHELRTPAAAMLATADVLKEGLYDTDDELKQFIHMIFDQGQHLVELINDILDFSKIQAGKMDYYVEQHNINKLLNDEIEAAKSTAEKSNIALTINIQNNENLCYYDDLRMRQIVRNILSNAIKYNHKDGSVEVWLKNNENHVHFFIKDTGKGIPEDVQEKVFDEFETLGKVALHHQGTGLGMPISKQMIESMGGEITFVSKEGVGSTFEVKVPTHKVLDEEVYRQRPDLDGDLIAS